MSLVLPTLEFGTLTEAVVFLMEIDKLKSVQRRSKIIGSSRHEDSAEYSWHFAVAAMSLAPYASQDVDIQRVIQIALMVYDLIAREAIQAQEEAAAVRLFGLLPEPQRQHFLQLWQEYETGDTANARFALMIDRIMPI